ncbi:MAG: DHA1 family inner membrane transport protein [Paracrocinitomix sp.]|jgi:DHA1 family inner membrane transport protein
MARSRCSPIVSVDRLVLAVAMSNQRLHRVGAGHEVGRAQLVRLTAAKAVLNTALRWMPFFLPTLAGAFGTTTAKLTTVLGVGETAGLSTLLLGRQLDGGRERKIMAGSLGMVAVSSLGAMVGNFWIFAVSYVVLIIGVSAFTVSGHAFLSRRVPFERRALTIGLFETSWAFALLIGAPSIAVLINLFGWRAPFFVLAVLLAIMAFVVGTGTDTSVPLDDATAAVVRQPLTPDAWILIGASAAIAMTGLTTIVIAGTWLNEALGVSTGGIGLVAMAFGAAEFTASSSSAAIADRAGPIQSTRIALALAVVGLLVMTQAGSSLLIGAVGLLVFFLGFEFSIVTSFSIVSEAMPQARGRALAANSALGTAARGIGIVMSGLLYQAYGIKGPVAISVSAAVVALALLTAGIRRS